MPHGGGREDLELAETDEQRRCGDPVGVLEPDDFVVGDAVAPAAGLLGEVPSRHQEGAGETIHGGLEVDGEIAGGTDDPVGELVGKGEAFALDVDPAGHHNGFGDVLAVSHNATGEPVDAFRQVVLDHLDALLLEQFAEARDGIHAEVPQVA